MITFPKEFFYKLKISWIRNLTFWRFFKMFRWETEAITAFFIEFMDLFKLICFWSRIVTFSTTSWPRIRYWMLFCQKHLNFFILFSCIFLHQVIINFFSIFRVLILGKVLERLLFWANKSNFLLEFLQECFNLSSFFFLFL